MRNDAARGGETEGPHAETQRSQRNFFSVTSASLREANLYLVPTPLVRAAVAGLLSIITQPGQLFPAHGVPV